MNIEIYTSKYIVSQSWAQLQKVENQLTNYLSLHECAFSSSSSMQNHLLDVLETRDKITKELNRRNRNSELNISVSKSILWEQSPPPSPTKGVAFLTPKLELTSQEIDSGYYCDNIRDRLLQTECGCLSITYSHSKEPSLTRRDVCNVHQTV